LSINPKGVFQENAVWHMVLGSKKPVIKSRSENSGTAF